MADSFLTRKLLIKPGCQVLLLEPPDGYAELLNPLPEGVQLLESGTGPFDVVHLFVRSRAELEAHAATAIARVKPRGVLWISYPKKSSRVKTDITRDVGWEVVRQAGWEGVTQIAVDETWSALRFRPAAEVGT